MKITDDHRLKLRPFQKEDRPALLEVIRKTWHYDRFCSPKTAQKMAEVYLSSCLLKETFTQTALYDGTAVGIIVGKNLSACKASVSGRLRLCKAILSLCFCKEGRKVSKMFGGIESLDQVLLQRSGKTYGGELAFFALHPDYRGRGIGKKLFCKAMEYMAGEGIEEFYLYTDTSCSYQFYERQGMRRQCSQQQEVKVQGRSEKMTFFLYDGEVPQEEEA